MNRDLSIFEQLDSKTPWSVRYSICKELFPSIENLNWSEVFRQDPEIMGNIVNAIIKASEASPGRPGKRHPVSKKTTQEYFMKLSGDDYSLEPFVPTFERLTEGKSIRSIASKTGIERNQIFRLRKGKLAPDVYTLEQIAKSFGFSPEYFLEYRVAFVTAFLMNRLESIPESSVHFYRKISKIGKYNDGIR